MRFTRRIGIAVVTAALAGGSVAGRAGDPPQRSTEAPVDLGLLEFLGNGDPSTDSTEPDDAGWLAYLTQINIGKAANATPATRTPAQPKPASSPGGEKPSG